MKTSAIVCTALAATMGFSSLASAQTTRQERQEARQERRQDARVERRQEARTERRQDARQEARAERRQDARQEARVERRQDARQDRRQEARQDWRQEQRQARRIPEWVNTPQANFRDPTPTYNYHAQPRYYNNAARNYNGPRFYRGGYLPYTYRQPTYYVNYRAYPRLYAPPYGYQWVHVGDEFLLIALASGLIATTLTM